MILSYYAPVDSRIGALFVGDLPVEQEMSGMMPVVRPSALQRQPAR
jgi:hypothetical protein